MSKLAIVFDGPPSHESGRFVEVELNGQGISFGEWEQNGDFWELVLGEPHAVLAMMEQFVISADETAKGLIDDIEELREAWIYDRVENGGAGNRKSAILHIESIMHKLKDEDLRT